MDTDFTHTHGITYILTVSKSYVDRVEGEGDG